MRRSTRQLDRHGPPGDTQLEPNGDRQNEKRHSASSEPGGRVRRAGAAIARICRGMSYDEIVQAAADARRRLGVGRPTKRARLVVRLSRPELEQLLGHAYRVRGERGLLVKTLVLTGARVAEFVAIDVSDFSYDDMTITIRLGKGGKQRVVPILPALADELRTFVGYRTAGPLFLTRSRQRFSKRRVQVLVKELAAGAGITKRVYPHLMRHTVAQHLLEGGMPLEQVQRFLGHASITTTQIYAESSAQMIRDSYRKALT